MLEGYITPLLMSYIDKYIKNIKPSDLQLSFWGGDAVLRNLELREDVLEREFNFPVEFKSGRIRELTLHIPWSAITSKPVEATIKDLEFVIKLRSPHSTSSSNTETAPQPAARSTEEAKPVEGQIGGSDGEQAPGYLQGYTSRISNNVLFHIQNMVVKVIEEDCDMMFTLNFGSVKFYTANDNWEKGFVYTDYFQGNFSLCKVLEVTDVAMNLHSIESSNQAEVTKEPFVQRCSFTCRIKSEFRGSLFVKKSIHLLFDSIHFFLDEKQFCLYLHFLDWLLAIYYSSKRLKGRDDCLQQSPPSSVADQSTTKPDSPSMSPTPPKTELEAAAVSTTAPQGESPAATTNTDSSQQGWGSYMWSYIGGTEEGVAAASATNEQETTPVKTAMEASSSFAIFAKAVSVTFKVTHVVQGPVFYSVRSFTRPVLEINLTGCLFQLDKEPLTRQFLVSTGAVSVHAAIANLCPCTKKFPTSWRSSAMATDTTGQVRHTHNYIHVSLQQQVSTLFYIAQLLGVDTCTMDVVE